MIAEEQEVIIMLTEQQKQFIKQFVDTKYFETEKIFSYLQIHDIVGDEIFDIARKRNDTQRNIRLVEIGYGYEPVHTNVFVRRVPFYFYVADSEKDQHGGLANLTYGLIKDDRSSLDWESLYVVLERMFYHHKLSVPDLMGYIVSQTGVINRTDLFLQWGNYLDLCEKLHIENKFPESFIYSYNVVLEKSKLSPIIYEPGLVGFNENFLREGNEIIIGGEFPCDEDNRPAMQWIAIWVENAEYITAHDVYSMTNSKTIEKELHIGLTPTTKIYMPNIYNSSADKEDIWYPIYFGPKSMEFYSGAFKCYRKKFNYTQQQVSDSIGIQLRTYQKWEGGETIPDGYNLIRLMNLFNINSVQEFIKSKSIIDYNLEKFKAKHKANSNNCITKPKSKEL